MVCSEVSSLESLAEAPVCRGGVGGGDEVAVAGVSAEGEGLPHHVLGASIVVPHLPPVARHLEPPRLGALDEQPLHVARACNVVHQHQKGVGVPVDGEPHASSFVAGHSGSRKQGTVGW
jgi:hypothetical protein